MNEKVEVDNIIEATKAPKNDSDDEEGVPKKKNEEEEKYHESIMQDIY